MRFPDPLNLSAGIRVLMAAEGPMAEEDNPQEGWRIFPALVFMHSSLLCSLIIGLPAALGSDSRQRVRARACVCVCVCVRARCGSCRVELQKGIYYSAVQVILNYSYSNGENGEKIEAAISVIKDMSNFCTFCYA